MLPVVDWMVQILEIAASRDLQVGADNDANHQ